MNVTLEVSVPRIIEGLANNSNDPAFMEALKKAQEKQIHDQRDFVTIFGEEFKKANPNARLAINFQTIELKGKIDFPTWSTMPKTFGLEKGSLIASNYSPEQKKIMCATIGRDHLLLLLQRLRSKTFCKSLGAGAAEEKHQRYMKKSNN